MIETKHHYEEAVAAGVFYRCNKVFTPWEEFQFEDLVVCQHDLAIGDSWLILAPVIFERNRSGDKLLYFIIRSIECILECWTERWERNVDMLQEAFPYYRLVC